MTNYIIYHQVKQGVDCSDGICAAWVAHKKYPNAEIHGAVYQEPCPIEPQAGDRLIIVDFSYPKSVLEAWHESGVEVIVIDHHKTALENLQDLNAQIFKRFDMNECGATLAWKTFFPNERMPFFLEFIRDRDLWNFELSHTEEVHEFMSKIGRSFDVLDELSCFGLEQFGTIYQLGSALLKPKYRAIDKAVERVQLGEVAGYPNIPHVVLEPHEDRLTSDICAALYATNYTAHFVACLTSHGTWSLRSDKYGNNTDVEAIAEAMGGGGHRNASGFKSKEH